MNIEWAKTFLEIVKYGSINLAAEAMFLSQSTISTRLSLLEEELGYRLLLRSKGQRSITLTNEGQAFLPMATHLVRIQKEAVNISKRPEISLRICAIDSFNRSFLNHFYQKLFSLNPKARFSISTHHSEDIYTRLEEHNIDLGFPSIELNRKNIEVKPLFRQQLYVAHQCSSPSGIKSIHPSALNPQKEIFLHQEAPFIQWHNYWWESGMQIRIDSFSLLSDFLSMDGYWAIVPYATICALPSLDTIQIYELTEAPPDRICYLLERKDKKLAEHYPFVCQILEELLNDTHFMKAYDFTAI